MKITLKVITAIFALGLVIFVLLHIFLQFGLTKAMREVVLPKVKQETGIDVQVDKLSINIAEGHLYLKGVAVRNPDGFELENLASVEKVDVSVDIPSLLKQKLIRVKNITVQDALVNVIRNQDGEININKIQEGLPKPPPSEPTEEAPPEAEPQEPSPPSEAGEVAEAPKPLPEILIEALDCQTKVRYVDYRLKQLDLTLALELTGSGVSTLRDPDAAWGKLFLKGSLGDDRTSFITDLELDVAPVTDPSSLTFDLTGKIMEIDPRIMAEIYDSIGIRSAPFGIDPELHCRDNQFKKSAFVLNLKNIELEDNLSRQLGGMGSIESLRFPVPVKGSLQEPTVEYEKAFFKALGGNTKSLFGAFIKGAASKELDESSGNVEDGVKKLGRKLFGN